MLVQGDCTFCEGSGKCGECFGTGINPHLNDASPKCPRCDATGVCPHCEGTGKTPMWRPSQSGSRLKYIFMWAAGLFVFSVLGGFTFVKYARAAALIPVAWSVAWYIAYRRSQNRKPTSASLS